MELQNKKPLESEAFCFLLDSKWFYLSGSALISFASAADFPRLVYSILRGLTLIVEHLGVVVLVALFDIVFVIRGHLQ